MLLLSGYDSGSGKQFYGEFPDAALLGINNTDGGYLLKGPPGDLTRITHKLNLSSNWSIFTALEIRLRAKIAGPIPPPPPPSLDRFPHQ